MEQRARSYEMKSAVDYLSDLIRIPSPSAVSNRPVIDYAAAVLTSLGWSTREFPYLDPAGIEKVNFIAAPPGQSLDEAEVDLVFVCHTDTVPYAAAWKTALEPRLIDGNLHGCGSCDVKSVLACLLAVFSTTETPQKTVRIVLTAEEEIGCIGAAHLLEAGVLRPHRMVIGEPTSLHPARAGKGYCLAGVTVSGKEAHSAHPDRGISAIYKAARFISAIEDLARDLQSQQNTFFSPPFTSINIGTIQGGTAKNIVAGSCTFQLEWRPIPGQPADLVMDAVQQIAERLAHADPDFHATITPLRRQPGYETSPDSSLVQAVQQLTGNPATSIPFGSEASIFAAVCDEIIVFGPGDMRSAHSDREYVPIAELEQAVACIRALL